ncbi:MAG: insulinase family protein [Novosphingobium sp.]|nr:insulinase family protein [Novosphingobium sp.]
MNPFARLAASFTIVFAALLAGAPQTSLARDAVVHRPQEDAWIYRGTDIPVDTEWTFGELPNGIRYAVRHNNVPPGQVSVRIRIDAGSLYETKAEQGFAHLLEHLLFRQSKYLAEGQAIRTWQRLGATFGSDTNAETTPTQTVYKLDLPNATPTALEESFKLLSGMVREPALTQANIDTEVPIVLAEKRERGGAGQRVSEASRNVFFAGQLLAIRPPIGTDETLTNATQSAVRAFHARWYRPENTVISVVGDVDPAVLEAQIKAWFADWKGKGPLAPAPDFGKPEMPKGADPANPVGETRVLVEPDLPQTINYAILRPYVQVVDNLEYNRGLLLDAVAQAIINRRLEARARSGGSYLVAQVSQDKISRSADGTFVSITPLDSDWQQALQDVRAVIADAVTQAPTQAEIDREVAELDVAFVSRVEERSVMAGAELADDIVNAVDIREAVASPEVVLDVMRKMKSRFTPEAIRAHTRALYHGNVVRAVMITPDASLADDAALRTAMLAPVEADGSARASSEPVSFADLPAIGKPGTVVSETQTGVLSIEQVALSNGVKALIWPNNAEPGRVRVVVRFGSGQRGFADKEAPYITLGEMALIGSGEGPLGQDELDRISTGRKMGFDFEIEPAVFRFSAETRAADLEDQLYLFAAKLAMPRWDANPVKRAQAAAQLQYESYATQPAGVIRRDLDYLLYNRDVRFKTPDPATIAATTPEGFRKVWEPLLKQGPIEILMFGDFDRAAGLAALEKTFGALPPRELIPADALTRKLVFPPASDKTVTLYHRGDANQAAAAIAWPTGGGSARTFESRQLEILSQVFNNRLMDAMREHAGASYAPQVVNDWPLDLDSGGRIIAMGQLQPQSVPAFFDAAQSIAADLAANPPGEDELARVTEPLRQLISRASTGNTFWLNNLEGATTDTRRIETLRSLLNDYTQTTPAAMQQLAKRYLVSRPGWRIAVLPEKVAPGSDLPD